MLGRRSHEAGMVPTTMQPTEHSRDFGILLGLETIGASLGVSRDTAARYVRELGLPARKLPGQAMHWVSSVRLVDEWIRAGAPNGNGQP